ncbi:hypothetical protein [Aquiflexum gelatinilyticum]|uniref:Tetratricopeptide repeat protein n=1 Tax=Aquiflexum gelatinilyticum TaxID=2961943 RepID=A0A9X2P2G5_9BACT|nr:hypothetical protein [Aquiflexum gelatinilyticum]MCR9013657.1 hypothetical protein [Aquiflexum gelatinilyticum]
MNYLSILKLWAFVLIPVFFGTIYFFTEEEEKSEVITFLGENNLDQLMGITLCREMAYVPEDFLTKPIGVSNVRIGSIDFPINTSSKEAQEMFNQGMAYYYSFDYVQAARSFNDGVRLDPEAAMIWNGLSVTYTNLSDTVKSKEFGTKAFELARKSGNRFEYLYTKSNFLALEPPSGMEEYQALYDSVYAVKDALVSADHVDTERFFRFASDHVEQFYSKPTGLPLILAALPEHHHIFRKVTKNSLLLHEGIQINPMSVDTEKLAKLAWEIMEPIQMQKLDDLAGSFGQAEANGKGSTVIKEVALAATEGRIETLLVEEDKIIAIRITNLVTGNTQNKDLDNPIVDDLLDDMGELVIKMGGEVMVLPADKMPSKTGLAAIYRY